jgi:hypothetical protein
MQIIYQSLHNIDLNKERPIRKKMPSDFKEFIENYVEFATTENNSSRDYIPIDPNRTVINCVGQIFKNSYEQNDEVSDDTELVSLTDSIALQLLTVEKGVQARIEQMTSIQKGSIVQALLKVDEAGHSDDSITGYQYVIAKVEHSEWIDGNTLERNLGFPGNNKKVWKSAVINISYIDDELVFDPIKVYVDHQAKYWSEQFLEVKEAKTDWKNTKEVLKAVDKVLKPLKKVSLADYYNLRNSVVHDLQSDRDINYHEMVDDVIDGYHPLSDDIDLSSVKDKLIEEGGSGNFDTQFHSDPDAIKISARTKIRISPLIDVTVKEGLPDWQDSFRIYTKADGRTYVMIKCDDPQTLSMFAPDKE